jgi:hypothetical protein
MAGRVVRVLSHSEFEAEIDTEVGEVVKAGDVIAIVISVYQEEIEYLKYLGELEKEEILRFLPDVSEGKKVAKCISLCRADLEEPRKAPKIGDVVEKIEDEALKQMHYTNGEFRAPYLVSLLGRCDISIVKSFILRLMDLVPEERELLEIILAEIEYNRMRSVEL